MEQELAHAVNTSSLALSEALSNKATGTSEVSRTGVQTNLPPAAPRLCCSRGHPSTPPSFSAGMRLWRWC